MGHTQLLLMVLVTTLTVISIGVGIELFQSFSMDSNREAVMADLVNYGSKAQLYYRTSQISGGGSQDFQGFKLSGFENDNANGNYNVTATTPSGTAPVTSGGEILVSASTIYIEGSGRQIGNDGTNPVKVFVTITEDAITPTVLN